MAQKLVDLLQHIDQTISRLPLENFYVSVDSHSDSWVQRYFTECVDIREKLRAAIAIAGSVSETNMQCLLHILALKRDKALADEKHSNEMNILQGRVEALSAVLNQEAQRNKKLIELTSLSKFWGSVIFPLAKVDVDHLNSSETAACAMAHLSSFCAKGIAIEYNDINGNGGFRVLSEIYEKVHNVYFNNMN